MLLCSVWVSDDFKWASQHTVQFFLKLLLLQSVKIGANTHKFTRKANHKESGAFGANHHPHDQYQSTERIS